MLPKVVQDAGYTVVGLGVLAVQQLQVRRRETRARMSTAVDAVSSVAKSTARPVAAQLDRLPSIPGPVGPVVDGARQWLRGALSP